jgi:hypothetical protein
VATVSWRRNAGLAKVSSSGPDGLAYDAAHNVIWFAEFNTGKIGRPI